MLSSVKTHLLNDTIDMLKITALFRGNITLVFYEQFPFTLCLALLLFFCMLTEYTCIFNLSPL